MGKTVGVFFQGGSYLLKESNPLISCKQLEGELRQDGFTDGEPYHTQAGQSRFSVLFTV